MENYKEILKDKLEAAEMVLVGIGEDFGGSEKSIMEEEKYQRILEQLPEEKQWTLPFFYAKTAQEKGNEKAYVSLQRLLANKNYFIVSLRTDDLIYKSNIGFNKERIVTPCGGIRKLQCEENCSGKIYDVPENLLEQLEILWNRGADRENVNKIMDLQCPDCEKKLVFNQIGTMLYCEEEYLPMWKKYTKWLQGTLNRKLCILELGVGLKYPSVVRWPFEKTAYFNQKACIFRIHHKLYQLTEELTGRGYAIAQSPTDFLANSFE